MPASVKIPADVNTRGLQGQANDESSPAVISLPASELDELNARGRVTGVKIVIKGHWSEKARFFAIFIFLCRRRLRIFNSKIVIILLSEFPSKSTHNYKGSFITCRKKPSIIALIMQKPREACLQDAPATAH